MNEQHARRKAKKQVRQVIKKSLKQEIRAANAAGGQRRSVAKTARRAMAAQDGLKLAADTSAYMHCLLNPAGSDACGMPADGGIKSLKSKVWAKGSGSTGSTGIGFVQCNPGLLGLSDQGALYYTQSAFAGTALSQTVAAGSVANAMTNALFSSANLSATTLQYRTVACGMRLRYTGTELNRAGTVYSIIEPDHRPLGTANLVTLQSYDQCSNEPFSREWHEVVYTGPIYPDEITYAPSTTYAENQINNIMALFITCPAATALTFDWEVFGHYEYVGPLARGGTGGISDPVGHSIVLNGVQTADQTSNSHHGAEAFITHALGEVAKSAISGVTRIGQNLNVQKVITDFTQMHIGKALDRFAKIARPAETALKFGSRAAIMAA